MREHTTDADAFYRETLTVLNELGVPYAVGGTFAVNYYTGMDRPTKDIDVFCKAGDYPKILAAFQERGYDTVVEDERWLAKVRKGEYFLDLIYSSLNSMIPVGEAWFDGPRAEFFDVSAPVIPATELVWAKAFVQERWKYDGADVAHLILMQSAAIDWQKLLSYMEQYWEVLLVHVLNFRFIYPSERELIPRWLFDELLDRLLKQRDTPTSKMKICRGRLFSPTQYSIDVEKWGFADVAGLGDKTDGTRHEQV